MKLSGRVRFPCLRDAVRQATITRVQDEKHLAIKKPHLNDEV